jgi:hypothetical protein
MPTSCLLQYHGVKGMSASLHEWLIVKSLRPFAWLRNIETSIEVFKVRLCGTDKFFPPNFFFLVAKHSGLEAGSLNTADVPEEVGPCAEILLNPYLLLDGGRLGCITCPLE